MNPIIRLTEKNCHDCYKCIRNCQTKAIRYADGHGMSPARQHVSQAMHQAFAEYLHAQRT